MQDPFSPSDLTLRHCELIREMHASCEPKGIGIEDRIEWIDHVCIDPASTVSGRSYHRRFLHTHRSVWMHRWEAEVRYEVVGVNIITVDIVEHICLRVVLLFCTHEISLGRTKLHKQGRNQRNGAACRVGHNASEMKPDSSSLELS
jgi:hypothetical protein